MSVVELSWEDWRGISDALRAKGLPSMLEHADRLEQHLDQPMVSPALSDDVS